MWPGLSIVHGKPRHSQSQGSVERSNQDVRDMLAAMTPDHPTKTWSQLLKFIQSNKNRAFHTGIGMSPYEAMFAAPQKIGLKDSCLLPEEYKELETEEDLEALLKNRTNESMLFSFNFFLFFSIFSI